MHRIQWGVEQIKIEQAESNTDAIPEYKEILHIVINSKNVKDTTSALNFTLEEEECLQQLLSSETKPYLQELCVDG